jgi:glycerol-3-phosphate dehydrogenase
MGKILRNPAAAGESFDLIIIGGGIYGAMLSLESSRRGLRSLLIERNDFGGATTFNCLRILHGGLRYLQKLDLRRFRESVAERRWFIQNFPALVEPLPCIMPLYGNGLHRSSIFRAALWVNDLLSYDRNQGTLPERYLPNGKMINARKTREIFPTVDTRGLQGGAVWYDAWLPDSQRALIEILRSACANGTTALNYVEARELLKTNHRVTGVLAIDRENNQSFKYRANVVINAAGPWCRELATRFDRDEPNLFRSSLAWNVLFRKNPISDYAVAVAPKKPKGTTYFLLPWKGMLLAGTKHSSWSNSPEKPMPSDEQIQAFLNDLNLAVPGLEIHRDDIIYVFAGLLPTTKDGTANLASREVILDHANHGGPQGLYSISGVKFTTSRLVAEKTLKLIFPEKRVREKTTSKTFRQFQDTSSSHMVPDLAWNPNIELEKWKRHIIQIIEEESVQHLDDLILRRTTLWENPKRACEISQLICELFGWENGHKREELQRLTHSLGEWSPLTNDHSKKALR